MFRIHLSGIQVRWIAQNKTKHHRVLALRHAQSQYNKAWREYVLKYKLPLDWKEHSMDQQFRKEVMYNSKYADPPITQYGQQQCLKAKQLISSHKLDLVIVSPQLRTLQTCSITFAGRNLKVIVDPTLAQCFRWICDVSCHMNEKKKLFSNYDYSEVDKHGELWYLQLLNQSQRQQCLKRISKVGAQTYQQKRQIIFEMLANNHLYEHQLQIKHRANMVKKKIHQYLKHHKNIAIVSHSYTLSHLLAKKHNQKHQPQIQKVENCYPYWLQLNE